MAPAVSHFLLEPVVLPLEFYIELESISLQMEPYIGDRLYFNIKNYIGKYLIWERIYYLINSVLFSNTSILSEEQALITAPGIHCQNFPQIIH